MDKNYGRKYDRLFTAAVVPYKAGTFEVDYDAYRQLVRYFLQPKFLNAGGAYIANPEAGEVFYLTYEEKKRIVEIAVEEINGKMPVFAGAIDVTTAGTVRDAVAAKEAGADGLFFCPPMGSGDVTYAWNPDLYPEVWSDMMNAMAEATDLPIIVHPTSGVSAFGVGLPTGPTLKICRDVPNIVGWKMTYSYLGWKKIAAALRTLDRHVAVLAAPSDLWHVALLNEQFDGCVNGSLCYAMEPMVDHVLAWRENNLEKARKIWNSGLSEIGDYVFGDYARLHCRYKVGAWLRGLVPEPFMRPPQPRPKLEELKTMRKLLQNLGLEVISEAAFNKVVDIL